MPFFTKDVSGNPNFSKGFSKYRNSPDQIEVAHDDQDYMQYKITKVQKQKSEELRQSGLDAEFNNSGIKGKNKEQIEQFINNTVSGTAETKLSGIKGILTHVLMKMAK